MNTPYDIHDPHDGITHHSKAALSVLAEVPASESPALSTDQRLALAQVHATLALAASVRLVDWVLELALLDDDSNPYAAHLQSLGHL